MFSRNKHVPPSGHCYHSGKMLVLDDFFEQPSICMLSGDPLDDQSPILNLELRHIPLHKLPLVIPLLILTGFLKITSGLLNGLEHTTHLQVRYSLAHKKRIHKRRWKAVVVGLILVGILSLIPSLKDEQALTVAAIFFIFFLWFLIIVSSIQVARLSVKKCKKGYFYLSGVHPSFLKLYPKLPANFFSGK